MLSITLKISDKPGILKEYDSDKEIREKIAENSNY